MRKVEKFDRGREGWHDCVRVRTQFRETAYGENVGVACSVREWDCLSSTARRHYGKYPTVQRDLIGRHEAHSIPDRAVHGVWQRASLALAAWPAGGLGASRGRQRPVLSTSG